MISFRYKKNNRKNINLRGDFMSNNKEEFSYLSITIVVGTIIGVLIGNFITESLGLGVSLGLLLGVIAGLILDKINKK